MYIPQNDAGSGKFPDKNLLIKFELSNFRPLNGSILNAIKKLETDCAPERIIINLPNENFCTRKKHIIVMIKVTIPINRYLKFIFLFVILCPPFKNYIN